jgi:hypothetical protein
MHTHTHARTHTDIPSAELLLHSTAIIWNINIIKYALKMYVLFTKCQIMRQSYFIRNKTMQREKNQTVKCIVTGCKYETQ